LELDNKREGQKTANLAKIIELTSGPRQAEATNDFLEHVYGERFPLLPQAEKLKILQPAIKLAERRAADLSSGRITERHYDQELGLIVASTKAHLQSMASFPGEISAEIGLLDTIDKGAAERGKAQFSSDLISGREAATSQRDEDIEIRKEDRATASGFATPEQAQASIDRARAEPAYADNKAAQGAAARLEGLINSGASARVIDAASQDFGDALQQGVARAGVGLAESKSKARIQTRAARRRGDIEAWQEAKEAVFRAAVVSTGSIEKVADRLGQSEARIKQVVSTLLNPKGHKRGEAKKVTSQDFAAVSRATVAAQKAHKEGKDPLLASIGAVMKERGLLEVLAFDIVPKDPTANARMLLQRVNLLETLQKQGVVAATSPDEDMALFAKILADAGLSTDEAQKVLSVAKRIAGGG
jgi:hypothetical protein